jgi:hypothetical protein
VVAACQRHGVRYSITTKLNKAVRKAIIPVDAWTPIPYRLEDGADVAETSYRPFGKKGPLTRLIVRRVRPTPGSRLALFCEYDYHPFITDRAALRWSLRPTIVATPRSNRPSVTSSTAPVWSTCPRAASPPTPPGWGCGIAYNLARWTGRLGVGEAHEHQDAVGPLPGTARPVDGVGPPAHLVPARSLAIAVAVGVRPGPAALHPAPDLSGIAASAI